MTATMTSRPTNRKQVAHVWASGSTRSGNAGNVSFAGNDYYSYSTCVARFVEHKGKRTVLITSRHYSSTTSQHVSAARQAVHGLGLPVFTVGDLSPTTSEQHRANLDLIKGRIPFALQQAKQSRLHSEVHIQSAMESAAEYNAYADFFGLRVKRLALDDNGYPLGRDEFLAAMQVDIDRLKAQQERNAKAAAKSLAASRKAQDKRNRERFREWIGDPSAEYVDGKTYLRIRDARATGSSDSETPEYEIETSRGARFPLAHAVKAWPLIKRCHDEAREFTPNGHTVHLGHFSVDAIDTAGNVRAGCHTILWNEIERIAKQLGLA